MGPQNGSGSQSGQDVIKRQYTSSGLLIFAAASGITIDFIILIFLIWGMSGQKNYCSLSDLPVSFSIACIPGLILGSLGGAFIYVGLWSRSIASHRIFRLFISMVIILLGIIVLIVSLILLLGFVMWSCMG